MRENDAGRDIGQMGPGFSHKTLEELHCFAINETRESAHADQTSAHQTISALVGEPATVYLQAAAFAIERVLLAIFSNLAL